MSGVGATLPTTGSDTGQILAFAVLLVALGATAIVFVRRASSRT